MSGFPPNTPHRQYDFGATPRGKTSLEIGGTMKRLDIALSPAGLGGREEFHSSTKKHHVRLTSILSGLLSYHFGIRTRSGVLPSYVVAPSVIGITLMHLTADGELWKNLSVSLWRASIGLTIGGRFGTLLGLFATVNRPVELYFDWPVCSPIRYQRLRSSLSQWHGWDWRCV